MGKSRLAEELARRVARPARVVSVAQVSNAEALCAAIASAASDAPMSARTGQELVRQTGRRLSTLGPLLLVLDGFDRLVASASAVLSGLLAEAPDLRIVVTSRERLGIADEQALELGPLDEAAAAALFAERARERSVEASDPRVQELLRRLEGVPLAIELAAARFDRLGDAAVWENLPSSTMRGAVAWSWNLLSREEQAALSGCAVFRGSFSAAAAEQILDTQPAIERAALLASLREKSLVYVRDDGGGAARFALYDVVRELALEKLREDERRTASLVERHDAWFSQHARDLALRIDATGDIHAREAMARELDNLLEVHERALERWAADSAARSRAVETLIAADGVLAARSSANARLAYWEAACRKLAAGGVEPRLETRMRGRLGQALAAVGELDDAQRELERALELADVAADRTARHEGLLELGLVHHVKRSYPAARSAYMAALNDAATSTDRRVLARVAGNLGALHHDEQRNDAAKKSYERSVELAAAAGDARIEGIMYQNLALLDQEAGSFDRALGLFNRALTMLEQVKDMRLSAITRSNRGMLYLELGRLDEALEDHETSLASLRHIAEVRSEALACVRVAVSLALRGAPADALAQAAAAREAFMRSQDGEGLGLVELAGAFVALAKGDVTAARRVLESSTIQALGSDDARTMRRILGGALSRLEPAAEAEADPAVLLVAPDASGFRPPGGVWREVDDNPAARRILAALAEARHADPHGGIEAPELIRAGWPDASFSEGSGRARLYSAIALLRERGLAGILLRRPRGYFLDPDVPWARAVPTASDAAPATRRSATTRRR